MKRRVVVTGLGAVTPIGNDVESFWNGVKEGKVGIGPITRFDTTGYKATLAAEVNGRGRSVHGRRYHRLRCGKSSGYRDQ